MINHLMRVSELGMLINNHLSLLRIELIKNVLTHNVFYGPFVRSAHIFTFTPQRGTRFIVTIFHIWSQTELVTLIFELQVIVYLSLYMFYVQMLM